MSAVVSLSDEANHKGLEAKLFGLNKSYCIVYVEILCAQQNKVDVKIAAVEIIFSFPLSHQP